jgi:hypothetical protein
MSLIEEKRTQDAARAATEAEARAEQAPIPISPSQIPLRHRSRNRTDASQTSGLFVTDDSQGYDNGFLPESPELVAEDVPPAYSEFHDQLNIHQAGFDAGAVLTGTSPELAVDFMPFANTISFIDRQRPH